MVTPRLTSSHHHGSEKSHPEYKPISEGPRSIETIQPGQPTREERHKGQAHYSWERKAGTSGTVPSTSQPQPAGKSSSGILQNRRASTRNQDRAKSWQFFPRRSSFGRHYRRDLLRIGTPSGHRWSGESPTTTAYQPNEGPRGLGSKMPLRST